MDNQVESAGNEYASAATIWSLGIGLMLLAVVLILILIFLLGGASADEGLSTGQFLLIVAVGGALGSLVHDLNSFVTYVGVGKLKKRWVPQYLVRPFLGMALAFAVTMMSRSNLLQLSAAPRAGVSPSAAGEQASPVNGAASGAPATTPKSAQTPAAKPTPKPAAADLKTEPTTGSKAKKSNSEPCDIVKTTLCDAYLYAAIAILVGMFIDLAIKKLQDVMFAVFGAPEPKKDHFEDRNNGRGPETNPAARAQKVIAACDAAWEANKSDDGKFVKAVADKLGIREMPAGASADLILHFIQSSPNWSKLGSGAQQQAKAAADRGELVIGGLSSGELSGVNGQVVVVVSGPLDPVFKRYPTAYWGKLNGVGAKQRALNDAFSEQQAEKVRYFVHVSSAPA